MRKLLLLFFAVLPIALAVAQGAPGAANTGFRISGKLVNSLTGVAISGAKLELGPVNGAEWAKVIRTDAAGRFFFDGLKSGKYQLHAEHSGYFPNGFDQHEGGYMSAIVVGGSVDSEHLVFRLDPACAIAGTVTDEYNEPVRDAQVFLFHRAVENGKFTTHFSRRAMTDDRGHYSLSPLESGTWFVLVTTRPWYAQVRSAYGDSGQIAGQEKLDVAYPATFYPGATEQSDAAPLQLRPGDSAKADITLHSVPAGRLKILRSPGAPRGTAAFLSQRVFDEELPGTAQMMSNGDGVLFVGGFAPGRYTIHVREGENAGFEQEMDLTGDSTIDTNAAMAVRNATITGLARAEGVTLNNAYVLLRERDSNQRGGAIIEADGKFKVDSLPPGKYEVSVANAASVYVVNMAASGAKAEARILTVPNGADVKMAIILAKGVAHIEGTALLGDKGQSGVLVLLVPEHPDEQNALFRRDQSDSDGTFTLPNVVPGKYTLVSIENGWELEWQKPEVLRPYLAKGTSVIVEPGGRYNFKVNVQPKGLVGTKVAAR